MRILSSLLPALGALLLQTACQGAKQSEPSPPSPPPFSRPWPSTFQEPAVLVADEIAIEGPMGLIQHVALRIDETDFRYTTKTLPEGLFQELATKAEVGAEARGQIDAWSLAAFRRITVLERPGDVPVIVRARGSAYWAAGDGQAEQREEELVFRSRPGN